MILAYHRVNDIYGKDALTVHPGNFCRQLAYLSKRGFAFSTLGQIFSNVRSGRKEKRLLSVTFDDGFADNLWHALPVLEDAGVKPMIFLTTGYIGTAKTLSRYKDIAKDRFLNWGEVNLMLGRGVEFGSHGVSHTRLSLLDEKDLKKEIFDSKMMIEDRIGREAEFFCYPYGDFNEKITEYAREAGYKGAVVTPGKKRLPPSDFNLPRTGVYGHNGLTVFRIKIWKDYLKTRNIYS